MNKKILMN